MFVEDNKIKIIVKKLIGISQSTHATHDTEYVVVNSIDTYLGTVVGVDGVVADSEVEGSVVDTGEVASTAGLVFFGGHAEGVYVDTNGRYVGVMLVRLYEVEVVTFAFIEAVVAVKFDESRTTGLLPACPSVRVRCSHRRGRRGPTSRSS